MLLYFIPWRNENTLIHNCIGSHTNCFKSILCVRLSSVTMHFEKSLQKIKSQRILEWKFWILKETRWLRNKKDGIELNFERESKSKSQIKNAIFLHLLWLINFEFFRWTLACKFWKKFKNFWKILLSSLAPKDNGRTLIPPLFLDSTLNYK